MKKFSKALVLASILIFTSCSSDDSDNKEAEAQDANVYITDAPIDNAEVAAAVVTITDIKVDGNSIEGFQKTTVNLLALQNGKTELLGNINLAAKSYSSLTLELDYAEDVEGNMPGCYVETKDGAKHAIEMASTQVNAKHTFEVLAGVENDIVIDFDIRKAIKSSAEVSSDFAFVTMAELENSIRVVNEATVSTILGAATDVEKTSDKIVVYAYEKGAFDAETEMNGQGESQVKFANAVSSSVVNNTTGRYSLHFLEEGEYELHYASYVQNETTGEFELSSMLQVEALSNIDFLNLDLTAGISINVSVKVTGKIQ